METILIQHVPWNVIIINIFITIAHAQFLYHSININQQILFYFWGIHKPETKTCFTPYDLHFVFIFLKLHINRVVWSWLWLFKILTPTWVMAALYVAFCDVAFKCLNLALPEIIFLLKSYLHFLLKFGILSPKTIMLLLFDVEECFPASLYNLSPV